MSIKDYSYRIESLLRTVKGPEYVRSDERIQNPYDEIISAIKYRIPQKNFDKFCLYYQGISGQSLQELIDENYDIEKLINNLKNILEINNL